MVSWPNFCAILTRHQFLRHPHSTHHRNGRCVRLDGEDSNDNCNDWATSGECYNTPDYMLANCCASCRSEFRGPFPLFSSNVCVFSVLHWANLTAWGNLSQICLWALLIRHQRITESPNYIGFVAAFQLPRRTRPPSYIGCVASLDWRTSPIRRGALPLRAHRPSPRRHS